MKKSHTPHSATRMLWRTTLPASAVSLLTFATISLVGCGSGSGSIPSGISSPSPSPSVTVSPSPSPSPSSSPSSRSYRVVVVPVETIHDVNANAQVSGERHVNGVLHAFRYDGNTNTEIDLTPNTTANAYGFGINNAGHVIGQIGDDADNLPFLWRDGQLIPLLPVPGVTVPTHGSAFDVNNNDVVCGFGHALEGGVPGAIIMHDAQSVTPIAPNGNSHALNDQGQAIGTSNDQAFRWTPVSSGSTTGTLISVAPANAVSSVGHDINESGDVTGYYLATANGPHRSYLYHNGQSIDLGTLGGDTCEAAGMNNPGQIVGYSTDSQGRRRGFLWENGAIIDINTLLDPGQDWEITEVAAIADNGVIAAYGTQNGQQRPLLLLLNP